LIAIKIDKNLQRLLGFVFRQQNFHAVLEAQVPATLRDEDRSFGQTRDCRITRYEGEKTLSALFCAFADHTRQIRKTRPEVEATIKRAQAAFEKGGVTYLIVLEANRQLIDTYVREAQLTADLRRAWAELERSVGRLGAGTL